VAGAVLAAAHLNETRDNLNVLSRAALIPEHKSGYYYAPIAKTIAASASEADILQAQPFPIPATSTYDRIGIACDSAGAGCNVRLGIYDDDGGAPGALIVDTGTFAITGGGALNLQTISEELAGPALYWLAGVFSSANATIDLRSGIGFTGPFVPGSTDPGYSVAVYRSFSFGALPDPWGTPDSLDRQGQAAIFVRAA
jgi:hypothetical protein